MSSAIEGILAELDGFRMCDQMDYNAYSRLHDLISSLDDIRWISVKDRLPNKGQIVIVSDGKHTWDVGQYQGLSYVPGLSEGKPNRWNWKKNTVKTVLWWMPKENAIPEPQKEESQDE